MKLLKNKNFYKFLIPSLIGMFLFVTPIQSDGNLTIPIAVIANALLNVMGDYSSLVIYVLVTVSALITIIHKIHKIPFIAKNDKLNNLFDVKGIWLVVRMVGLVFVNMLYWGVGYWDSTSLSCQA